MGISSNRNRKINFARSLGRLDNAMWTNEPQGCFAPRKLVEVERPLVPVRIHDVSQICSTVPAPLFRCRRREVCPPPIENIQDSGSSCLEDLEDLQPEFVWLEARAQPPRQHTSTPCGQDLSASLSAPACNNSSTTTQCPSLDAPRGVEPNWSIMFVAALASRLKRLCLLLWRRIELLTVASASGRHAKPTHLAATPEICEEAQDLESRRRCCLSHLSSTRTGSCSKETEPPSPLGALLFLWPCPGCECLPPALPLEPSSPHMPFVKIPSMF